MLCKALSLLGSPFRRLSFYGPLRPSQAIVTATDWGMRVSAPNTAESERLAQYLEPPMHSDNDIITVPGVNRHRHIRNVDLAHNVEDTRLSSPLSSNFVSDFGPRSFFDD